MELNIEKLDVIDAPVAAEDFLVGLLVGLLLALAYT